MRSDRQLIATHGSGFRLFEPFFGGIAFAAGCDRSAP
jgi:hypothetical protein